MDDLISENAPEISSRNCISRWGMRSIFKQIFSSFRFLFFFSHSGKHTGNKINSESEPYAKDPQAQKEVQKPHNFCQSNSVPVQHLELSTKKKQ